MKQYTRGNFRIGCVTGVCASN